MIAGTQRYWPVSGGFNLLSLARCARTAAMFPPALPPPTMNPAWGVAPSEKALSAALDGQKVSLNGFQTVLTHFRASQQSLMPVGNLCSGPSLSSVSSPGFSD